MGCDSIKKRLSSSNRKISRLCTTPHFEADFTNSLKALYLLSMEMDYIVGQQHNPIGTLNKKFRPLLQIPELAKPLFKSCKDTVLKKYS